MSQKSENLSPVARIGEVLVAPSMLILSGFFVMHQVQNTGFFTEEFGTLAMLCLYLPIVLNMFPYLVRAYTGRRNPARPFEVVSNFSLAVGSLYLLMVFPFDYTHLAEILFEQIRFLLAWMTDDIARFIFVLQILTAFVTGIHAIVKYGLNAIPVLSSGQERVSDSV